MTFMWLANKNNMKARQIYPLVIAGISLLTLSSAARADEFSDWFKVDGFGTVGGYKGNSSVAGVRTEQRQWTLSFNEWKFDGDSQNFTADDS